MKNVSSATVVVESSTFNAATQAYISTVVANTFKHTPHDTVRTKIIAYHLQVRELEKLEKLNFA